MAFVAMILVTGPVGRAFAADELGQPPASLILDETRLFDEQGAAQTSAELKKAKTDLGLLVYVAGYPYLEHGAVRDRALALADHWCGANPGLVIVFNRGDGQAGIAASDGLWRRYPPDEAVEVLAAVTRLLADTKLAPEGRVKNAVQLTLQRMAELESTRRAREQPMTHSETKLAEWFAAALMVLGVLAWLALLLWRRHEARRQPLFFPEVNVGTRLGAPFGGGVIGVAGDEEA
jgi:hypothetical protein